LIEGILYIFVLFLYIVHLTAAFNYSLVLHFVACTRISLTSLRYHHALHTTEISEFS